MKKIAIIQSNYIPWKGYFDLIASVDEFIFFDDMQYTRRDWRNRNKIKTSQGLQWLTVPVLAKGKYHQKIRDTQIYDSTWLINHWKALVLNYSKAQHFDEIATWLEPLYCNMKYLTVSELNHTFIRAICNYLGINTYFSNSWDYLPVEGRTERLVDLCIQAGATEYVSGPSARGYLNESIFIASNLKVSWFDYSDYKEYPQLWGDFIHHVSILDLLFNCGENSRFYMRYV